MSNMRLASIILAAGQGTRMKSERAKVLFPLAGEPLVAYPLRLAFEVGADPVVLVIGHQREVVRERVEALFPQRASYAEQLEQKGTGHAVMQAMKVLEGRLSDTDRVLILYGDVPLLRASTIRELMSLGERHRLALVSTIVDDPKGYGRIVRTSLDQVERIVEEKDATDNERKIQEINAGIYLVEAKFLASALARLRNDNAQKEYYLTDLVAFAIADGHEVGTVIAKDSAEVLGVNNRRELAHLDAIVRRRVLDKLMLEGVSITDPERTYVSARAET
jgi:bifunctional UDP-N-acetylglucosamine pyrophosphorylase / glucosamine-1-phosphate N-acetyltransferase